MPENIFLSVIIPSYLEEQNLDIILPGIKNELERTGRTNEVLVIDTLSPMDNTKAVCEKHGANYVNRAGGNSYGDAVRTGISIARGEKTLFMDADGSHPPEMITELVRLSYSADVAAASRYAKGGGTENPAVLIAMSRLLNRTYSLILGINCKDVSNSFKLYDTAMLKQLSLACSNFDIIEEMLFKLKKQKYDLSIAEAPFIFKKRMFGKTKRNLFMFVLTYIFSLVRLRLSR